MGKMRRRRRSVKLDYMKNLALLFAFLFSGASAVAEDCTPEATQRLGALMAKVTSASKTVDDFLQKHKVRSQQKSDLILFCLSDKPRTEFKPLFNEAAPAVNDLEQFGNAQTGLCRDSALRASKELEDNVRIIMARFEQCKQTQK